MVYFYLKKSQHIFWRKNLNAIRTYIACIMTAMLLLMTATDAFSQVKEATSKLKSADNLLNFSDFTKLTKLPEGFDAAADSYEFVGEIEIGRAHV